MSLADDYIGIAAERRNARREQNRTPRSAASQIADSGAIALPATPEEAAALQREEAVQRSVGYAQQDRDLADRMIPFGAGPLVRPFVNMASDPDRRRRLGERVRDAGIAVTDAAKTPQARLGAALMLTPGLANMAPAAIVHGARQIPNATRRLGHGAVEAAREAPSALAQGFDWFANDPAPREFVAGLPRAMTYGPWENERLAQQELDASRARGNESGVNESADAANLETLFTALNAPLPGLGIADDAARTAQVNARRLGRSADAAADAERVYRPTPQTEIIVAPDGRISALYQGAFEASAGSADEVAAALREGSGQEALGFWRSMEGALNEDIAATQRPEYYWTPGAADQPNERLARFYRRALQTHAPDGYAFSETPDGVMRLSREALAPQQAPDGFSHIPEMPVATRAPPGKSPHEAAATARSWVEGFGGGQDGEQRAISVLKGQLSQLPGDESHVAVSVIRRDLEGMIDAVQTGAYRQGARNTHSAGVEAAFPEMYARNTASMSETPTRLSTESPASNRMPVDDGVLANAGRNRNPITSVSGGPPEAQRPAVPRRQELSEWREVMGSHPWINSPARAQLVIMASAKDSTGRFIYDLADIVNTTRYSENTVPVMLNQARAAGVDIPLRPRGGGGATRPPGGNRINAMINIMERAERNGEYLTGSEVARRMGISKENVHAIWAQIRNGSGQRSIPADVLARFNSVDAAQARRSRRRRLGDAADPDMLASAPLAIGAGAGAALLSAGDAEAQGLQEEQTNIQRLEEERRVFDQVDANDPDSVRAAQQILLSRGFYLTDEAGRPVRVDGVLGGGTALAIRQYREQSATDLAAARERFERLKAETAALSTQASPAHEAAREIGPWLATAAGVYLGHRGRIGSVRTAAERLAESNARADALITSGPIRRGRSVAARTESASRASNVNDFWRLGGAGEAVPFTPTQSASGFRRRSRAAEPSSLFPPGASGLRSGDYAAISASLGEAGISGGGLYLAQQELTAAQEAAEADPSEANLARLERARDMVKLAESAMRAGLGYVAGRLTGAARHGYSQGRPNIAAAETERMMLDQFLASSRKPRQRRLK